MGRRDTAEEEGPTDPVKKEGAGGVGAPPLWGFPGVQRLEVRVAEDEEAAAQDLGLHKSLV